MGWTFRRRVKFGPINLNFSRSGVGVSASAGPIRAGVDAKGRRYTNVRGPFGLNNRQYHSSTSAAVQPQSVQASNSAVAKDSLVVFLFALFLSIGFFSANESPETRNWWALFMVITGVPGILGLVGYLANKDRFAVGSQ